MAELSGTTTARVTVFTCPACKADVQAVVVMDLSGAQLHPEGGASITLQASVGGLRVSHDCTPKTTRSTLDLNRG